MQKRGLAAFRMKAYLLSCMRMNANDPLAVVNIEDDTDIPQSPKSDQNVSYYESVLSPMLINFEKNHYVCNMCQKTFSNINDHVSHLKTHAVETPYTCCHCHMTFSESKSFEKHVSIHAEQYPLSKRPYVCEVCKKSYVRKERLNEHLKVHGKKAGQKKKTRDHKSNGSVIYNNEKLDFPKSVISKEHLMKSGIMHNTQKFCIVCKNYVPGIKCLANHMRTHKELTIYVCKLCHKVYIKKSLLVKHVEKHGKRKVGCNFCKKTFSSQDVFAEHLKQHKREGLCITMFSQCE